MIYSSRPLKFTILLVVAGFLSFSTCAQGLREFDQLMNLGQDIMLDSPDSARTCFILALNQAQASENERQRAKSTNFIGVTYQLNGQYQEALEYYLSALEVSQGLGDKRYVGIVSNNIGAIHFEMGNYDRTEKYYSQAYDLFKQVKDTFWLSNSTNNLANIYKQRGKYNEALEVYGQSLELAEVSDNLEALGSATSNLGNVYSALGEVEKALSYYEKGLGYQQKAGDRVGVAISHNNVGQSLSALGRPHEALRHHQQALAIARDMQHLETIKNSVKRLRDLYEEWGHFEKAYAYQTEFVMLSDSLIGLEKTRAIEDISKKYETEQKERRIIQLELDQKESDLALANSENFRNIILSVLLIVTILMGALYYQYTTKKKHSDLLAVKNEQISTALEERELLLKEIHHRVKNNLQVISGLLYLQAEALTDAAAVDAVKEGQQRVKSMALIHQKFYSTSDIRGVDIQDYFENLVMEILTAFGVGDRVSCQVNTNRIKLDIDTVIPLGLMVNELITNSIKYAFPEGGRGEVVVEVSEQGDRLHVHVKDTGKGFTEEEIKQSNSFGWRMVRAFARKVKASIAIDNSSGTDVHLTISRYKLVI